MADPEDRKADDPPPGLKLLSDGQFTFEPTLERVAAALERLAPQSQVPTLLPGPGIQETLHKILAVLERIEMDLAMRPRGTR